ncbi:MAG: response regulator transcription factor [Ignavibacteriales bacterium]|nr:MAG: response regulator transcription factor [Ignavibacteriales bacterium]
MIQVFIADDHSLIREGFKKILKEESDITVAGESGNPFELADKIISLKVDVLILDINLPGKSGLDVLKEIKILKPGQKILILSMHPEERFAVRSLKAGASGYLTKDSAPDELVKAIRKVASGGKYISPNLAEKIAGSLDTDMTRPAHELLSDREFQIMHMMALGKSQTIIADELALSLSTVNTYRTRVLEKLNISSNAELIHYAITNKLID